MTAPVQGGVAPGRASPPVEATPKPPPPPNDEEDFYGMIPIPQWSFIDALTWCSSLSMLVYASLFSANGIIPFRLSPPRHDHTKLTPPPFFDLPLFVFTVETTEELTFQDYRPSKLKVTNTSTDKNTSSDDKSGQHTIEPELLLSSFAFLSLLRICTFIHTYMNIHRGDLP